MVYVWEWRTYRDYELRNVKSLEKLQRQMKRLMQYYGLDTTEIPEGAYGGPPPPPPVSERRASDGVVGRQQPLVDPTPTRLSLPTRVDGRQGGGFQAAYPLQVYILYTCTVHVHTMYMYMYMVHVHIAGIDTGLKIPSLSWGHVSIV